MYDVHDWTEVRPLFHREHLSKSAISERLGISRPTVIMLLQLSDPPRYERTSMGSKLDAHAESIRRCSMPIRRCRPRSSLNTCALRATPGPEGAPGEAPPGVPSGPQPSSAPPICPGSSPMGTGGKRERRSRSVLEPLGLRVGDDAATLGSARRGVLLVQYES